MAYTSADNVKNLVGSGNVVSTVTDAMIWKFINRADGVIDTETGRTWSSSYQVSAEDSGVDKFIEGVSAKLAGAYLLRRLAAEELEGVSWSTGPVSEDRSTKMSEWLKLAGEWESEALVSLKKVITGAFHVKRTI